MPPAAFFNEKDFPDEQARRYGMSLLEKAASVEITNPVRDAASEDKRNIDTLPSAIRVSASLMLRCLHRGPASESGQDQSGGTAEIVDYAKALRRAIR